MDPLPDLSKTPLPPLRNSPNANPYPGIANAHYHQHRIARQVHPVLLAPLDNPANPETLENKGRQANAEKRPLVLRNATIVLFARLDCRGHPGKMEIQESQVRMAILAVLDKILSLERLVNKDLKVRVGQMDLRESLDARERLENVCVFKGRLMKWATFQKIPPLQHQNQIFSWHQIQCWPSRR